MLLLLIVDEIMFIWCNCCCVVDVDSCLGYH